MSIKKYLILMGFASLICWLSWLTVIFYIDPTISGSIGFICFYISLFFSLLGTFSLAGLILRLFINRHELPYRHISVSLRQSLWFAILISLSLMLLGENLFTWWSSTLLVIGLATLECFFLIQSNNNNLRNKIDERRTVEN